RLDGRRVPRARATDSERDRRDRRSRARAARARVARAAPGGAEAPAELRRTQGVLREARRAGALVTVWLVGAGPGDPGLITARGLELVRDCDALVYDRLVSPELVAEAPDEALV